MFRIPEGLEYHVWMAGACTIILSISAAACIEMSVHTEWSVLTIGLFLALAAALPLPIYWHERQRIDMRDAAATIPWALILAIILPLSVDAAARVGKPLQDANFVRLDDALGINVQRLMAWSTHSVVGAAINESYELLIPLLPIAILVPALTGRWRNARGFLFGNIVAFAVGLPLFALFPAVGPWYGYHLGATREQMQCQRDLFLLRVPGPYTFHPAGVVCFPSFHVIWAVLCGYALWEVRILRIPVTLLSGAIILSTVTTGWHYFSDLLAGLIVAALAIVAARSTKFA